MFVLYQYGIFSHGTDINIVSERCNHTKLEHEGLSIDDVDMGI